MRELSSRFPCSVFWQLVDCLNAAAYSRFFKLATGRVIVK